MVEGTSHGTSWIQIMIAYHESYLGFKNIELWENKASNEK